MEEESCCICLFDLKDDAEYETQCKHTFRHKCLTQSINSGNVTFPLCRQNLDLQKIFSLIKKIVENSTDLADFKNLFGVRQLDKDIIMDICRSSWHEPLQTHINLEFNSTPFHRNFRAGYFKIGDKRPVFNHYRAKYFVSKYPFHDDKYVTISIKIEDDKLNPYKKIDEIMHNEFNKSEYSEYKYQSFIRTSRY